MKIDYVIIGSNLDTMYLDFWPIISKTWKEIFNITPVLGLICDEDSEFIQDEYGIIKKYKAIDGIDTGLQSQIVRLFLTKELNGNVIISDIDMLPLSKDYFINQILNFDKTKIYVMSSDNVECNNNKEIPMCYNIGDSQIFSNILEVDNSWIKFCNKLNNLDFGWTTDQRYLWDKINKNNRNNIVFLNRGWGYGANKRIDRINWVYNPNLVKEGYYIDSHLLRPFTQYKKQIDDLINLLY